MRMFKNKKGASVDNIWWAASFFALAIFFLVVMVGWLAIDAGLSAVWTGSSVGTQIQANAQNAVNQFDWILIIVWFGFHIGILATSFLLRTHLFIYPIAILLIAIVTLLAAPLSNAWEDMTDETELNTAALELPKTNFILDNFVQVEMIWGFITAIVLFFLAREEGFV